MDTAPAKSTNPIMVFTFLEADWFWELITGATCVHNNQHHTSLSTSRVVTVFVSLDFVKIIKDNMSESIWILSIHHWGANSDSTPPTGSTCYATYSSLTFVIHNPCWAGQRFWWHSPNDLVSNLQGTLLSLEKQCPQLGKSEQLIWLDSHTTLQVWIVSTKLSGPVHW